MSERIFCWWSITNIFSFLSDLFWDCGCKWSWSIIFSLGIYQKGTDKEYMKREFGKRNLDHEFFCSSVPLTWKLCQFPPLAIKLMEMIVFLMQVWLLPFQAGFWHLLLVHSASCLSLIASDTWHESIVPFALMKVKVQNMIQDQLSVLFIPRGTRDYEYNNTKVQ